MRTLSSFSGGEHATCLNALWMLRCTRIVYAWTQRRHSIFVGRAESRSPFKGSGSLANFYLFQQLLLFD